jgi:L-malate glycosyltransferase
MIAPATRSAQDGAAQDRRLRVLWLIKGLGPGGAETLLSMIAEVRDRSAFEYEIAYLLPWKDAMVADLETKGIAVHCLNGTKEWNPRWALRLRRLLSAGRFDIVHVHSPYVAGVARLVVRSIPRSRRPKMVSTEHVPWWSYARPTRILNALTFSLDDAHLTVTRATQASIPARLRRDVRVVLHGVFVDRIRRQRRFRDEVRAELGVLPEEVLVGTVANYRAQKGYPDLLRAAKRVIDQGLPARFVAIGQGPLEEDIRGLHRELDLGDRLILTGYRADATRILAGCDIFFLASLYEGLPVALMEALALGLPVVVTDVEGIREVVTDGVEAILAPPSRPEILAEALETVIRQPEERERMARAAKTRASSFEIGIAARKVEQIYREVSYG